MADPIPEPTAKESQQESYGRYYSPVVGSPLDQLDTQQKTTLLSHISRAEVTYGLGSFIIEFQLLETLIKDAISFLLNPTNSTPGRIVTAEMPFQALLNTLVALFHDETRDDEKTNVLRAVLLECLDISARRNAFVHSYWYTDDDGKTVRLKMRVKGLKPYREDEEKEGLGTAVELQIQRCRETFKKLKALMDEQFPRWTTAEIPDE
jgi:hypothetical protein